MKKKAIVLLLVLSLVIGTFTGLSFMSASTALAGSESTFVTEQVLSGEYITYTNGIPKINLSGSLLALFSGFTYATYVLLLSGFRHKEISGFTFSFYVALVCSVTMFIICIATGQLMLPFSLKGWLWAIIFAVSLNVGAVVLFQKGTFLIDGSRASILSTFEPITSIFAGVLVFNETVNTFTSIGALLVITASILITTSDMKKS